MEVWRPGEERRRCVCSLLLSWAPCMRRCLCSLLLSWAPCMRRGGWWPCKAQGDEKLSHHSLLQSKCLCFSMVCVCVCLCLCVCVCVCYWFVSVSVCAGSSTEALLSAADMMDGIAPSV